MKEVNYEPDPCVPAIPLDDCVQRRVSLASSQQKWRLFTFRLLSISLLLNINLCA